MPAVRVEGVVKRFGEVEVLREISLAVPDRSLVTLLGPSGCGKSTFLRLVAGLEAADEGRIFIGERLVTDAAGGVHVP
jgi:ABC-type sugar transport system ATPase subunit